MKQEITVALSGGKSISFETGRIAKQAHGAALTRIGDTVTLTTAVANQEPREGAEDAHVAACLRASQPRKAAGPRARTKNRMFAWSRPQNSRHSTG